MQPQVKPDRDPKLLEDLIAAVIAADGTGHGVGAGEHSPNVDPELVRELRSQIEAKRPSHDELETVDFQRLDAENDWTDV